MAVFKIGDVVFSEAKNACGVIKVISLGSDSVGVEFFQNIGGHNLEKGGKAYCKTGYGWFCGINHIKMINKTILKQIVDYKLYLKMKKYIKE